MSQLEENLDIDVPEDEEVIEGQGSEPEIEEDEEEAVEEDSGESQEQSDREEVYIDKTLLNKERREKYRYLNKIQELQNQLAYEREQAEQLRYLNDVSTQTALSHYESAAKERLDRAKDLKEAALDSGDNKAMIEADIALNRAVNEYENLMREKAAQDFQAQSARIAEELRIQQQQNAQPQQSSFKPNLTEDNYITAEQWVNENPWFKIQSPHYDSEKHALANQLLDNLDVYCYQNGMGHLIGSPEYFSTLDQQIKQYSQGSSRTQNQAQSPRGVVAPARGRGGVTSPMGQSVRRAQEPLSSQERAMAARLGISEKDWRHFANKSRKTDYFSDQAAQRRERT